LLGGVLTFDYKSQPQQRQGVTLLFLVKYWDP
jgi:hypothetical protein